MIHNNQFEYDNAMEPELSDYQDDPMFADFVAYVANELMEGRDWKNLSSANLMFDLECLGGGYQKKLEWVWGRVTEKQYLEYLDELSS